MLFLHPDPSAVSDWCHSHVRPGTLLVSPSAAARRQALRTLVERDGVVVGVTITARGQLLPRLEAQLGLRADRLLRPELERMLAREAGAAAGVPLFEKGADGAHAPPGAVRALVKLVRDLRLNFVSPDEYEAAGGDARAAEAYRIFEARRTRLGLMDEADRHERLVAAGVPALNLVMEEPHAPHLASLRLLKALVDRALSCHVGMSVLDGEPPLASELEAWGVRRVAHAAPPEPEAAARVPVRRAVGGAGVHDEVSLVAREMLALARRPGTEVSSILGVAPTSSYLSALHEACAAVGLPVASPRRMRVSDVPLVRALLQTFRLLADEEADTPEHGLALLGTPCAGLTLGDHDRLAKTMLLRGLGSLRSWTSVAEYARPRRRARFARLAEALAGWAEELQQEQAPSVFASVLTKLALDHGFISSSRREFLASGRDESVRVDQQGWEKLTEAIERVEDALHMLNVRRLPARRWLHELESLLAEETVRVEARAREGVHLTVAGAGLPVADHVFAVGWREGLVPRRVKDDPLLPEAVKRRLNENGARLVLASDRAGGEVERRERVVRASRQSLTISWPVVDDEGNPRLPSYFLEQLGIEPATTRGTGDPTWPLTLAASRSERLTRSTVLARHRPAERVQDEVELVRSTLKELNAAEHRRWSGSLNAQRKVVLPEDILLEAADMARAMSASQSRMLAHCQFEHFGTRRLALHPLEAPVIDARRAGTLSHRVLAEAGRASWREGIVDELLAAEWERLDEPLKQDPETGFEWQLRRTQLKDLVAAERVRVEEGRAPSRWFELSFGHVREEDDPESLQEGLTLSLPAGSRIAQSTLRGTIDRVDVVENGGVRYAVAVDYKSGKGASYLKDMQDFADFQLPIYWAVLPMLGVVPVGAYFLGISSGERYGVIRKDLADHFVSPDDKGVKRLEPDEFERFMRERNEVLLGHVARLAAGEIEIAPRDGNCGYCELRPVCRVGTFGVGGVTDDA